MENPVSASFSTTDEENSEKLGASQLHQENQQLKSNLALKDIKIKNLLDVISSKNSEIQRLTGTIKSLEAANQTVS